MQVVFLTLMVIPDSLILCVSLPPNRTAYQGKTSISTVGTSTSAYRLSLATMSRSNTGTGTVWEQDSQPSRQPSQDTLSRTDEDDEESQKLFQFYTFFYFMSNT